MSRFTPTEDLIIRRLYPQGTQVEILALLPTRKWRNILERARLLGTSRDLSFVHKNLKDPSELNWSSEEIEILSQNYLSASPSELTSLLPKRTWAAIKSSANKLGLVFCPQEDINGQVFNFWKVVSSSGQQLTCLCIGCGLISKTLERYDVIYGRTKSCGCQKKALAEQSNLKNFGTKYYTQTPEYQIQKKQTNLQKYGVEHNFDIPATRKLNTEKTRQIMKCKHCGLRMILVYGKWHRAPKWICENQRKEEV